MKRIAFKRIVEEYIKDKFPPNEDYRVEMRKGTRFVILNINDGFFHPLAVVHDDNIYALEPKDYPVKNGPMAVRIFAYESNVFERLDEIIRGWIRLKVGPELKGNK